MQSDITISQYDYDLPEERIAKFPLPERENSKLLVWRQGDISETVFRNIGEVLPSGTTLVFNNTKVIRARIIMHKPTGARIEIFCLEPAEPADYERAFSVKGSCKWHCIIGNAKKWKEGPLEIVFTYKGMPAKLLAFRDAGTDDSIVRFEWDAGLTFGELLEHLGRIPIPPYLGRDSEEIDNTRYQTVYSKVEGSVAAPTAGLHFGPEQLEALRKEGNRIAEVTLHVGAGTFLPVKSEEVTAHTMHTEHFSAGIETVRELIRNHGNITAVGTTTVRTLESLCAFGLRILRDGTPRFYEPVGQWELYDIPTEADGPHLLSVLKSYMTENGISVLNASTRIMIMPGFRFRVVRNIVTNFHQPKSTLLLLVSAFTGNEWHEIYNYALDNGFRFLSYGDSSILLGA